MDPNPRDVSKRYTTQEHEEWRKEKEKEVAVRHFVHLMWIPKPLSPSPPGTEPLVQAVMSLWSREDRWKIAAVLQREGGSLREHGEESWWEIE